MREAWRVNNFRMWAYSMIAVGAINWDYQRHASHVALHSLLIIIPGVALLALTYLGQGKKLLSLPKAKWFWGFIGVAALIYAFTNK